MLPTSRSQALSQVLDQLDAIVRTGKRVPRLRVSGHDGAITEGQLAAATVSRIALRLDDGSIHEIAAADIRTIHTASRAWLGLGSVRWWLWFDAGAV